MNDKVLVEEMGKTFYEAHSPIVLLADTYERSPLLPLMAFNPSFPVEHLFL